MDDALLAPALGAPPRKLGTDVLDTIEGG